MKTFTTRRVVTLALLTMVMWPGALPARSASMPHLANPALWKSLTTTQRTALQRYGFEVGPFDTRSMGTLQFFDLYKDNLGAGTPSFITTDAILHMFHIMYDKTLVAMERELLFPKLQRLSGGLLTVTTYQHNATQNAAIRDAARLDMGFVAVAQSLLKPAAPIPALIAPQVRAERTLIAAHRGLARSPLFGYEVDYSQFAPRGHYNLTTSLRSYFMAMMWYGRVAFLLNGPEAPRLTREALLLVRGVTRVPALTALWSAIFDPATAWVGHSDDLTMRDYAWAMARIYGGNAPVSSLADNNKLARFISLANSLPNPQINSDVGGGSAAQTSKGMRFFPQRFIPDAAIMQALIWNKVGTAQQPRRWPMGLDVAAALGSTRANALVNGPVRQNWYAHYTQKLNKIRHQYARLPSSAWSQNLYWHWLDTLRAVWGPVPRHAPSFMTTRTWADKTLATGLGSWAELRHDTLLYAKQPYGLGAGGGPPPFRTPYVEPVPAVWSRLLELTQAFKKTLSGEGLLDHLTQAPEKISPQLARTILSPTPPRGEQGYRAAVDSFLALVALLQRTAQGELNGLAMSHANALTLENIGTELEILDGFFQDNSTGKYMLPAQKEVPIIADIFTEPGSGQVLEEGVGKVLPLYAVITINGRRWLTSGGVFSYYEFHQPMSNRLTDEAWRAMSRRPALPAWTEEYIVH